LDELKIVFFKEIERESSIIWGEIDKLGESDPIS